MSDDRVHVRITDYPNKSWGVKTEIDGFELSQVGTVVFTAVPGEIPCVTIEMWATRPMEIDISAKVTINVIAMEGCEIVESASEDGQQRRMMIRRQHPTAPPDSGGITKKRL